MSEDRAPDDAVARDAPEADRRAAAIERFRSRAREAHDDPAGWFEAFYREAGDDPAAIPWADGRPNPNLVSWLDRERPTPGRALVVGCGLGEDAEELAARGFDVVAFDVAPRAVEWARARRPDSSVDYCVTDLFEGAPDADRGYAFVFEAYTLQALPPRWRLRAIPKIAEAVAPGGTLLVVTRGAEPEEARAVQDPPWPLTAAEVDRFRDEGLKRARFEDYLDDESPPKRRFRATFVRDGG